MHIRSKLECAQVYSLHQKKLEELKENVQRRAVKIAPELKELSYREKLEAFNLLYHLKREKSEGCPDHKLRLFKTDQ